MGAENPATSPPNSTLSTTPFDGSDAVMHGNHGILSPAPASGSGVEDVPVTLTDLQVRSPSTQNVIQDRIPSRAVGETLESQQMAQPEVVLPSRFPSSAPGTPANFKPDRVLWPENALHYESVYTSSWVSGSTTHGKPSWPDPSPTPHYWGERTKYPYGASEVPLPPSWVNTAHVNITPERQIHPLLDGDAPSPIFHFDLAPGTFAPLRLVSTDPPHGAMSDAEMREPAFHPPLTKLRILHSGIPLWHLDLQLSAERALYTQATIALGDVLVTVHHAMHERIRQADWAALSPENERAVTKAFTQRCRAGAWRTDVPPGELRDQVVAERNRGVKQA